MQENLLRALHAVMQRWGDQQPDEKCWADAAATAAEFLQQVRDSRAGDAEDDTEMEQVPHLQLHTPTYIYIQSNLDNWIRKVYNSISVWDFWATELPITSEMVR